MGSPLASRQIFPPIGSGVLAVILASARARVLASTVCPKEERTMIGRRRFQHIERGAAGLHASRAHAFLKPAHHFKPGIRIFGRRVVEARLDPLLQFGDGKRFVVEAAFQELRPASSGCMCPSTRPGIRNRPFRSTDTVAAPTNGANPCCCRRRQFVRRESRVPRRFHFWHRP